MNIVGRRRLEANAMGTRLPFLGADYFEPRAAEPVQSSPYGPTDAPRRRTGYAAVHPRRMPDGSRCP